MAIQINVLAETAYIRVVEFTWEQPVNSNLLNNSAGEIREQLDRAIKNYIIDNVNLKRDARVLTDYNNPLNKILNRVVIFPRIAGNIEPPKKSWFSWLTP
jgi:hypothetical protein